MFASVATRKSVGSAKVPTYLTIASVPPTKSECSRMLAGHSGWAIVIEPGRRSGRGTGIGSGRAACGAPCYSTNPCSIRSMKREFIILGM